MTNIKKGDPLRSLWGHHASQVILRRGLRWRLGNGDNINVWRQPWLHDSNQPHVTTTMIEGREEMKIAELIINSSITWNHELIQHIFNDRYAHEIAKIPLNLTQQEDAPMWRFSKSGTYSVRSAYYQLMENIIDDNHLKEKVAHSSSSNTVAASHSWTKPPAGALKCNVDTTCYMDHNLYGIGACIRDAQGRFDGKPEVAEAEALGLLEAMQWIQNSHMPMFHVETVCLQVVHAIRTNSRNNTEFGKIIDMCRNLINLNQN
ncbi:hypothetical protein TSUD_97680 [Trifolium subterraneum]|uniref:RNase H type-1 domain-containing protein n=1 Tax=Trifolium subterraneum TaxID=3900 RepID=A0A2Z6MJ42_TRISU|nr:hypothetical protein TSUD_97680 [Trifolium subterraneum]